MREKKREKKVKSKVNGIDVSLQNSKQKLLMSYWTYQAKRGREWKRASDLHDLGCSMGNCVKSQKYLVGVTQTK